MHVGQPIGNTIYIDKPIEIATERSACKTDSGHTGGKSSRIQPRVSASGGIGQMRLRNELGRVRKGIVVTPIR